MKGCLEFPGDGPWPQAWKRGPAGSGLGKGYHSIAKILFLGTGQRRGQSQLHVRMTLLGPALHNRGKKLSGRTSSLSGRSWAEARVTPSPRAPPPLVPGAQRLSGPESPGLGRAERSGLAALTRGAAVTRPAPPSSRPRTPTPTRGHTASPGHAAHAHRARACPSHDAAAPRGARSRLRPSDARGVWPRGRTAGRVDPAAPRGARSAVGSPPPPPPGNVAWDRQAPAPHVLGQLRDASRRQGGLATHGPGLFSSGRKRAPGRPRG